MKMAHIINPVDGLDVPDHASGSDGHRAPKLEVTNYKTAVRQMMRDDYRRGGN